MKRQFIAVVFVLYISFVMYCNKKKNTESIPVSDGKLNVITTIIQLYDYAKEIAKEQANITILNRWDIANISDTDIFLYVGDENDTWVERILDTLDTSNIKIVRLFDFAKLYEKENNEEHIWENPKNAVLMITVIMDALCDKDSLNCEFYTENSRYLAQFFSKQF